MKNTVKENNHLYPQLHIKYWKEYNAKKYLIKKKKIVNFSSKTTFSRHRYYSNGEPNDFLENRISTFESYIGTLIQKIDNSTDFISLSGNEVDILKLYVYFCGCRHEFTTEVIKYDETNIYESNNYLLGMPKIAKKEDVIKQTNKILDEFDRLKKEKNEPTTTNPYLFHRPSLTAGLHLVIIRAEGPFFIISNRFCIIENTMDSDHLYSYVPITPTSALLLVKTKYYFDNETFVNAKRRLSLKHYGDGNDEWLSMVFGSIINCENILFCSYGKIRLAPSLKEEYIKQEEVFKPKIKINKCPNEIVDALNWILIEDGDEALFCDEDALNRAKTKLLNRTIKYL